MTFIIGTIMVLGFLLYIAIQLHKVYQALVARNGVQYKGFNAEEMPSIYDEAWGNMSEERLGEG